MVGKKKTLPTTTRIVYNKGFIKLIPSPIHAHITRFLIDALNNSIGFTYGYLRLTPSGLDVQFLRG